MEYFSPYNCSPNGETNYVPTTFPISAPPSPRSQVVGEGDVTAVTWPNGTLQLFFVPARSYFGNILPWGVLPAWFIRTVPNLFPAPQSSPQPFAANHRDNAQSSNFYLFPNKAEESEEKMKYQIHFHNDKVTSTTDMHYFCQPLPCSWYSKQSVETQASQHVKFYDVMRCTCCTCCKACACEESGRRAAPRESAMSVGSERELHKKSTHKVNTASNTPADQCDKLCNNCKTKSNVYKAIYV